MRIGITGTKHIDGSHHCPPRSGRWLATHVDDTLYVVTCFVELVSQRSSDVLVE